MNFKILLSLLFLTSCAIVPTHHAQEIEYCEKVDGIIYCKDIIIDTNCNPRYMDCTPWRR